MVLKDFLTTLNTPNVQVVIKDTDLNVICKIHADAISKVNDTLANEEIVKWNISRNNLVVVYIPSETAVIRVTGIELDQVTVSVKVGETVELIPTIMPEDATNQNVTWTTSDEEIATVENGIITGVKEGMANVIVTTDDGAYNAVCVVNVNEADIPVTGVEISEIELNLLDNNEDVILTATVLPEDATNKEVVWASLDENVVTVENGVIHVIGVGTTMVTVTTVDGEFSASCSVYVTAHSVPITDISLDKDTLEITVGDEDVTLVATVLPSDTTDTIVWSSEDENVAIVENGIVHAISSGNTIIKATSSSDENIYASCSITVLAEVINVTEVSLDKDTLSLLVSQTDTLVATVLPENASNNSVTWSSTDDSIVEVDENGLVTAIAVGEATITVTTVDGNFTATCVVTVSE